MTDRDEGSTRRTPETEAVAWMMGHDKDMRGGFVTSDPAVRQKWEDAGVTGIVSLVATPQESAEVERLRSALEEIIGAPGNLTTWECADIARAALNTETDG